MLTICVVVSADPDNVDPLEGNVSRFSELEDICSVVCDAMIPRVIGAEDVLA